MFILPLVYDSMLVCYLRFNISLYFLHVTDTSILFCSLLSLHVVARIALVKPDKARGVEDVILRAAQMGQITEKVP